jgi:hypothetical protein
MASSTEAPSTTPTTSFLRRNSLSPVSNFDVAQIPNHTPSRHTPDDNLLANQFGTNGIHGSAAP